MLTILDVLQEMYGFFFVVSGLIAFGMYILFHGTKGWYAMSHEIREALMEAEEME